MKRKTNNKGFIFNIVVIVIIVISFIIAGCIGIVMANWNMKKTERNIQTNYYSAEMAIDDIKSGIEEGCALDIENAYSILISSVNTIPYDKINDEFKEIYVENLKRRYDTVKLKETLKEYINQDSLVENQTYGVEFVSEPSLDLSSLDDNKIYLRNIGVSYISSNNVYLSRIFTDIEIGIPKIYNGTEINSDSSTNFTEYTLIADNTLNIDCANSDIIGGVYAGDGGVVIGKSFVSNCNLVSNSILTRGNIEINRGSKLSINGLNNKTCQLYADNFIVSREGTHGSYNQNVIAAAIKADMFLKGDTLLNAKYGSVNMSGNYYGYSTGSSAFCINGKGVTADLSNMNTLWIAGTSYVDLNSINHENVDILMGESLTYKGTQSLYLVPSVCIIDVKTGETLSNPLTSDYFKNGVLDSDKCIIDINENKKNGGIDLTKYIDSDSPYKAVFVDSNGHNGRVYLYLKFNDKYLASKYSEDYANFYKDYMNDRAKSFALGNIILGENTSLKTVGNVINYDGEILNVNTSIMSNSNEFISYKENYFNNKYNSLVSTLEQYKTSIRNNSLFDYLIDREAIHNDLQMDGIHNKVPESDVFVCDRAVFYDLNADGNKVLIADGDVDIQGSFNGLVITTGNINITSGVTVNGLIISGGNITTGNGNCKFSATFEGDYPILYLLYEWAGRHNIGQYFKVIQGVGGNDSDTSFITNSTVKYRNWVME